MDRIKTAYTLLAFSIFLFLAAPLYAAESSHSSENLSLSGDMILVLGVLVFAIVLFVFEWVRVDVVGIIMMVLLPILGLVSPDEAISGLSSNAVVSIIAVIIIGAGLEKTGLMNHLAQKIIKLAGYTEKRVVAYISGTVALISGLMQNIGAVALFMPAALRVSRQTRIPLSRILMPMGFCAIVGGTMTLVGASPTILLNDLIDQANQLGRFDKPLEHFGLFTQTPIGIALAASAILYFVLFGKFVLPVKVSDAESSIIPSAIADTYEGVCTLHEIHVPEVFGSEKTLEELQVRTNYKVSIIAISHTKAHYKVYAPSGDEKIFAGDDIVVIGCPSPIYTFSQELGLDLKKDIQVFAEDLSTDNAGVLEGIITHRSELAGKTLRQIRFRKTYELTPLILCRGGDCNYDALSQTELRPGDTLLLFGKWENFRKAKQKNIFTFTSDVKGVELRTDKAGFALTWLAISLSMVLGFNPLMNLLGHPDLNLSLSICLLTGALGMILTKVLTIDEAYQSVDWMTVFLLAGLIPLGLAFQKTGAAEYIAIGTINIIGDVPVIVFFGVIAILTSFFTLVVSNVGATVLLVPLSMTMAVQVGADPRLAALVVALSASNTFILPTHQVNALIMRPGGYHTIDYVKAGAGMTVLFLVVMLTMLYFFY